MQLEVIHKRGEATQRLTFAPGQVTIGRQPDCQVVLEGKDVAPLHALASWHCDRWVLVAAAKHAAIEVRGRRLKSVVLGAVTQAMLGDARVTFVVQSMAGGDLSSEAARPRECVHSSLPVGDFDSLLGAVIEPRRVASDDPAGARRWLLIIRAVVERLVGPHDLAALLQSIVDLVFAQVRVERVLVLLGQGRVHDMELRALRTRTGSSSGGLPLSHTIADEALDTRRALLVVETDLQERFRSAASVARLGIHSALCAPLLADGAVRGLLYADRTSDAFTTGDLETFSILAHLAAAALAKQDLVERLQREQAVRQRLLRYHAPAVIDHVLRAGSGSGMLAQDCPVTVLFADLVGFTALSERLPAAEVQALLNRVLGTLTEAVFEEQGTLDKFIGDAVMVFFGAPLPQPDHALRAVRTALAMQRRVRELATGELAQLSLRIGINTGPAMVGEIGAPNRRDYTVIGDTVNVASRLESAVAKPGQIVVNATTRAMLGSAVECRALGEVTVRNRQQPIQPWLIEGLAATVIPGSPP